MFVVRLKPHQSIQQLPSPEQNPIFSYEYVHHEASGGAYIADIFDKYVAPIYAELVRVDVVV